MTTAVSTTILPECESCANCIREGLCDVCSRASSRSSSPKGLVEMGCYAGRGLRSLKQMRQRDEKQE